MTVDIATLGIRIDSSDARTAARDMENFRGAGARAEQQVSALDVVSRKATQALQLLGVGAGVGAIIRMADEYIKYTAQIKLATQSQREYSQAVDDVRRIANTAQQDLAATGTLYARITNGTRELGVEQKRVAAITETVNLALKVSGATAQESASAQLQLSQAFASGTLRGEEFNAVNEAAPRLMKALADGIGVPIGALKDMASNGEITSKVMAQVLPQALEQLRDEAKQVQTIAGAFTVLKNNVLEFVGTQAQASGTVSVLAGGIELLANNLNILAGVAGTFATANVASALAAWTVKTYERINAAYAQVAAENAVRAASISSAEAEVARTAAVAAGLQATQAAIVVAREEMVARLSVANANISATQASIANTDAMIAQARTAIAASSAAGALSTALRVLRDSTRELAVQEALRVGLQADLAIAEQARAASMAELAILGQQQARVSAQVTAATAAQAAAQTALTAANGATVASVGLLGRAIGVLGGPIGAIVTVLGLAATAWSVWGGKAKESSQQAAESFDEAQVRIIKGLDEQIAKNEKLIQLQGLGQSLKSAERDLPAIEQLSAASKRLSDINNLAGEFEAGKGKSNTDVLIERAKVMKDIVELTEKMERRNSTADAAAAFGPAAQALIEVRERLTGVNGQYLKDLKALQAARDANAIGEQEYIKLTSALATETWKSSDAGKAATAATNKAAEAYKNFMASTKESIAQSKLEYAAGVDATEQQKARIKFDQFLADSKVNLAAKTVVAAHAASDEAIAWEKNIASQRSVAAAIVELNEQRRQDYATAVAEATANEQAAATFGLTKAQVEALTVARLEDRLVHAADLELTVDDIAQTERLIAVKKRSVDALTKSDALGYIKQLTDENKRFAADSIIDERARAAALLEIDAEVWRKRIALAGAGTEQQKQLQEQFDTWYRDQSIKPMLDEQREAVKKYDDIFRQGFADMLNNGKSGWKSFTTSLITTFKTTVADQIYKMLAQPFVVSMVGNLLGVTGTAAAQSVAGSAGGSAATSALGSAAGSLFGSGGLSGSLMAGAGWLTGSTTLGGALSAGASLIGTGTLGGITSGLGVMAGALGPIALGVAGIMAVVNKLDNSGTYHTGGASSASAAGVQTIAAESLNFQPTRVAAETNAFTAQIASSVVSILDSTALAFGKTAGYTAATAFADDTSKDGAWGGLVISKLGEKILDWQDTRTSRWAPKEFADGAAGQKEYLAQISTSVRSALDGIGLPSWAKSMLDALGKSPALEDLAKVVDSINATQKAFSAMGQRLAGFASLSDAAISALIKASGGIEGLTTNAGSFYENFYSEGEKAKVVTDQVASALKAVGLAMPTTRDEYRAQVEAQLALGASGATATAALLANAAAFASVTPEIEDVTKKVWTQQEVLSQRTNLKDQLDELTMSQSQLAEKARAAIAPQNQATYELVVAAKAAKDAIAEANTVLDLQAQTAAATGDKVAAAAILEQQHAIALKDMTPAVQVATQAMWDAQAAEKARAAATAESNTLLGLQAQLADVTGDKAAAAAVLEKQHAAALVGLTPAVAAATKELWAAQAAEKAHAEAVANRASVLTQQAAYYTAINDKAALARVTEEQRTASLVGQTAEVIAWTRAAWAAQDAEKARTEALTEQNTILQLQAQTAEANGDAAASAAILQQQHANALIGLSPAVAAATQAMWDATAATEAKKKTDSLTLELLNAQGKSQEALNLQRAAELAALSETERAIKQMTYAAQDAAKTQSLQIQLLKVQGKDADATKLEREAVLAGLSAGDKAIQQAIYAAQDKADADKKAADIAQQLAQAQAQAAAAQQQAADQAAQAAKQLKDAWQGATDSIIDEVKRIRGLIDGGGGQTYAAAQSAFAIATAQARAGDQDAAKQLPSLSKAMLDLAEANAVTSFDLRLAQAQAAASLQQTASMLSTTYGLSLPSFDVGTDRISRTGLAMVHEGEAIVPAASNAAYTGGGISDVVAEIRALRQDNQALRAEVASLRESNSRENYAIARHASDTADKLDSALNGDVPFTTKVVTE